MMNTYFTIGDFILIIPMALAGILFLGAVPCATQFGKMHYAYLARC